MGANWYSCSLLWRTFPSICLIMIIPVAFREDGFFTNYSTKRRSSLGAGPKFFHMQNFQTSLPSHFEKQNYSSKIILVNGTSSSLSRHHPFSQNHPSTSWTNQIELLIIPRKLATYHFGFTKYQGSAYKYILLTTQQYPFFARQIL